MPLKLEPMHFCISGLLRFAWMDRKVKGHPIGRILLIFPNIMYSDDYVLFILIYEYWEFRHLLLGGVQGSLFSISVFTVMWLK